MNLSRRISEHRPEVILAILVSLALASLLTGTEATLVHQGINRLVAITAYPFLKTKYGVEGAVDYAFGLFFSYDALRTENAVLEREKLQLKAAAIQRAELLRENERLRRMLHFVRNEPRFSLEPVRVIESYKGMLRIDRGAAHGIEAPMCVVTEEGVVGLITEVGDFSSVVATLHHPECNVGAMVQRNRLRAYDGVIHASGSDLHRICTMDYIDMKDDVRVGDAIVTSPESLFPPGYPIGTVSAPPHDVGSLWKTVEVSPWVDPYRLDEVFVIRRAVLSNEELAGVQPKPFMTGAVSGAPTMPDERSIQERYAP